jgi:hypothetical protein
MEDACKTEIYEDYIDRFKDDQDKPIEEIFTFFL